MNFAQDFITTVKVVSRFVTKRATTLIGNRALMIVKVSGLCLMLCVDKAGVYITFFCYDENSIVNIAEDVSTFIKFQIFTFY